MMKKHFQQIDVLKGAAIVSVIALHSLTKPELVSSYAIYHIWQAVPLFMILMGLNLGLGLKPEAQKLSTLYNRSYFTKKATRILLPFLIIFILSLLLGFLWQYLFNQDLIEFKKYTWIGLLPVSGKGNYFITLLLQSILVLPLVSYCFSRRPLLTTIALVLLEVLFLLVSKHYNLFDDKESEYLYSAALPRYFSALALGLWLAKAIKQRLKFSWLAVFLGAGTFSILYLYLIIYGGLHIPLIYESWDMQNVFSFGYPALLILSTVYVLPASSDNIILRGVAYLGQASYHIFLVQVLYFGLTTEHSNLLFNEVICLSLGYLFYVVESPCSKMYVRYLEPVVSKREKREASIRKIKVLCGIVENDGLVLITQRSETMSQPLLWEFPGGKLEPGETEQECLAREIREELQISVSPQQRLEPAHYSYPDKLVELIPYTCTYNSGTISLLEHLKYEWVKPNELIAYTWCPADVPIVKAYLQLRQS